MGHFLLSLFPMSPLPTRLSPLALSISAYLTLPQTSQEPGLGYPTPPAPLGISSDYLCREGRAGMGSIKGRRALDYLLLQMVPHATHWLSV